jgi:hypothetical protein
MARKAKENICASCRECGAACEDCVNSPQNGNPVKLYTPKGAVRAMLLGKVLKGKNGEEKVRWDKSRSAFVCDIAGYDYFLNDFSGLWEEL